MIAADWVRTMARYNAWQNEWMVEATQGMTDDAAEQDRGGFFGSFRKTASHVMWADEIWLSRFVGAARNGGGIDGSTDWVPDMATWRSRRPVLDAEILVWADGMDDCEGDLTWHSPMLGREVSRPRAVLFAHYFNHQTHHRGQMHQMLTSAGLSTGVTDLFVMPGLG
ncbi:DinB family protein [Jannaschia donghaensis]|uniref:DinB family protein n=1 Tax=Jannaschia donghaensis TaxID=420998 RepID=A0A0M6YKD6_9RHOB|nr:DinB family protein [Jannaschia donghaensis]CTQ50828.1 DinB family protein [Jannaschia donghaensis]